MAKFIYVNIITSIKKIAGHKYYSYAKFSIEKIINKSILQQSTITITTTTPI